MRNSTKGFLGILVVCAVLAPGMARANCAIRNGRVTLAIHKQDDQASDGMRAFFIKTNSHEPVESHVLSTRPAGILRSIDIFPEMMDGNLDVYKHGIGVHLWLQDNASLPATIVVALRQRCAEVFELWGDSDLNWPAIDYRPEKPGDGQPGTDNN